MSRRNVGKKLTKFDKYNMSFVNYLKKTIHLPFEAKVEIVLRRKIPKFYLYPERAKVFGRGKQRLEKVFKASS